MRRRGYHIQFLSFIFVSSSCMTAFDRETTWTQRLLCSSFTHSDKLNDNVLPITLHGGSRDITHTILNPCARYWWLVNATFRSFHLDEKSAAPNIQKDGWGPAASLDGHVEE